MADTMGTLRRTHYCGVLRTEDAGKQVVVCGFVQRVRDMGNLIFIDLRDRTGIVQIALDESKTDSALVKKASSVHSEYVLMIRGTVELRQSPTDKIPTGAVEIVPDELKILSEAATTPFEIQDQVKAKEELRLRYRYLDLRRAPMQEALRLRHRVVKLARDYFDDNGFLEIETPILIRSSPEGARDYLVPSRVHPGQFYALPQSPQLYKQLLMIAGVDRYMQVARCFRDEDLRADRQPEFTQIDLEMSFADVDDVIAVNEGFMKKVFHDIMGMEIETPFRRITYKEAMERFGSDKPDTRFGLELRDLSDVVRDCGFAVFDGALAAGGSVRAINVKGAAAVLTRKEIDKLTEFVRTYRAKGLAFTRATQDAVSSSFEKKLAPETVETIHRAMDFETGDVLLVVADADQVVFDALGALRCHLAQKLDLIPPHSFDLLWVVDFPQFEYSEEEGRFVAKHHPFTAPKDEDWDKLETDPGSVNAKAYDMVLNGCEVGGGSVRINDPEKQARMFKALGFTPERAKAQFGYLMEAFSFGAPPHAGMAYGLDRLVMLLAEKESIRDVIAFPKVQTARELMVSSPSPVDDRQLDELSIAVTRHEEEEPQAE